MAFDESLMQRSCKHSWQLQQALSFFLFFFFFTFFFGEADRIIVSPDEGRTGSDLTPEVSRDHLCRTAGVRAVNQNTSPAKIKVVIRVVIIVLANTVPETEKHCESWICSFLWFSALQCG